LEIGFACLLASQLQIAFFALGQTHSQVLISILSTPYLKGAARTTTQYRILKLAYPHDHCHPNEDAFR
jgi:hypothetical protein